MSTRAILFTLALAAVASTGNSAEVTTTTGRSYRDCKVLKVSPDGVTFRHSKGVAKVLFMDMTDEAQKEFGYDPDKERAYHKKQEDERAKKREVAQQQAAAEAQAYAAAQQSATEARTHQALQLALITQAGGANQGGWGYYTNSGLLVGGNGYNNQAFDGRDYARHARRGVDCPQPYSNSLWQHNGALVNYGTVPGYGSVSLQQHYGALVSPRAYGACAPVWSAPQIPCRGPVISVGSVGGGHHGR